LEELDPSEESPCAQPDHQKRFNQAGAAFVLDPYPAASASDLLPVILGCENDDVVLHNDYVDFGNRTQQPVEKLQNSLRIVIRSWWLIALSFVRSTCGGLYRGLRRLFVRPAKVSFDAQGFVAIAFPPQIQVRWLSGRKRRFAKALYL
jgi:hypothetical protein